MTYFEILLIFILPPLVVLAIFVPADLWRLLLRRERPSSRILLPYWSVALLVLIALVYTTPWDNYLVATYVWWYDPDLVTGLTIGYVPIEEYTFFIVQSLLTGLWTLAILRRIATIRPIFQPRKRVRWIATQVVIIFWTVSTILLIAGWKPGNYITLILSWSLLPVMIQFAYGADILWSYRRVLVYSVLFPSLYLWFVDAIAIRSGTWTIDPAQTTRIVLANLPIEEMLFFFITNVLIAFGITLMLAKESRERAHVWLNRFQNRHALRTPGNDEQGGDLEPHLGWQISAAIWLIILLATPICIWIFGPKVFPLMASLCVLAQLAVVLAALSQKWRFARIFRSIIVIVVFAWVLEWLGSSMGVPFGKYSYSQDLLPQIGAVPLIIPIAWAMMLFPAWAVGQLLLRPHQERLGRAYPFLLALLSGLAFTAWDLYLDPQMVGRGLWAWEDTGTYFGIPVLNYLGWWLVAIMITLIVRPKDLPAAPLLIIYSLTWLYQAIGLGVFWEEIGPALSGFIGMGIFTVLAWRNLTVPWDSVFQWLPMQFRDRSKNAEMNRYV